MALIHKSKIIAVELYITLKEVECFQHIKFCAWAIFVVETNSKATRPCLVLSLFSFTLKTILFK